MLRIGQIEITAQDNKYTDGNVAGGIPATRLRAAALNAIQEELAGIVEAAGQALDPADFGQVLKALKHLFAEKTESLGALAALTGAANKLPYFTGANAAALTDLTSVGRDILAAATKDAVLTYLGLGDGPFVSAGGGSYNNTFKFGQVETLPTESNTTTVYSTTGGSGTLVSGIAFKWHENQFDVGISRDASTGTNGLAIAYNGRTVALMSPGGSLNAFGDLIASGRVFESDGVTRVYSANNPQPNVVNGGRWSSVTERAFYNGQGYPTPTDSLAVFNIRFVGGGTNDGFIQCRYLQMYINGAYVTIL